MLFDRRLKWKTRLFAAIVVVSNALGNFFLARGMRRLSASPDSPLAFIQAIFTPWVALGITLLIVWLLSRMALLSWADLSYVLPVTSVGYVLTAVSAWLFLNEQISPARWAGVTLIMAGVAFVGRTEHSTTGGCEGL